MNADLIGQIVRVIVPHTPEFRERSCRANEHLEHNAREGLARACAEVGLAPSGARKVWHGSVHEVRTAERGSEASAYQWWVDSALPDDILLDIWEAIATKPEGTK